MGVQIKKNIRVRAYSSPDLCVQQAVNTIATGGSSTIVNNEAVKGDISGFTQKRDCQIDVKSQAGIFHMENPKGTSALTETMTSKPLVLESAYDTVLVLTRNALGAGDDELGALLMRSYLCTLAAADHLPLAIILLNSGVKLAIEGVQTLEYLRVLQNSGVQILACDASLNFYHLNEKLASGRIINMCGIIQWINAAGKVITL